MGPSSLRAILRTFLPTCPASGFLILFKRKHFFMCGIIGILGQDDVAERLVEGLRRLEYRGYDSAGVATVHDGQIERRRAEGKLNKLARKLGQEHLPGHSGIAHTRWATHGAPTEDNAH